jgi:hypothetical protein
LAQDSAASARIACEVIAKDADGSNGCATGVSPHAGTSGLRIASRAVNESKDGTIGVSARLPEIENLKSGIGSGGPDTDVSIGLNDR